MSLFDIGIVAPPRAIAIRAILTLVAMMVSGGLLVVLIRALKKRPKDNVAAASPEVSLVKRYLTLMALVFLVLGPAFLGGWLFVASVVAIAALGVRELFDALDQDARSLRSAAAITTIAIVIAAAVQGVSAIGPVLGIGLAMVATWGLVQGVDRLAARVGGALLGMIYLGVSCAFMVLLRRGPSGFGRYLYFLVVIQMADLGGLFGGMAFGKTKLAPKLSPGKTWEGTITSLAAAAAGGALFAFAMPEVGVARAAVLAVPLAVTGLLGDLFASGLKRSSNLKDFGTLLPGHGGVLDRFDSYLVSAPVAWAIFAIGDRLG